MFVIIMSYIFAFALGGAIGATIVSWYSVREARRIEAKYSQHLNTYKDLLDTAMHTGKYFEDRCEQLESELNQFKLGGKKHG